MQKRFIAVVGLAFTVLGCVSPHGTSELRILNCKPVRASLHANQTLAVPVAYKTPSRDLSCAVTRVNLIGEVVSEAWFQSGVFIAEEFRKVVGSNFHLASQDETPAAVFSVSVERTTAKVVSGGAVVEATVCVRVDVTNADRSETCYSRTFEKTAQCEWKDRSAVPLAFCRALESVMEDFTADWDASDGPSRIIDMKRNLTPQIKPPSLRAIEWSQNGDVWTGICEVECNGYEGFEAKSWANMHIASACRTKLGNIEPARVRVVYDEEQYFADDKKWKFAFRTFARTSIALSYDPVTRSGVVTGDVELMGAESVERAAEALKKYVLDEMETHGRLVTDLAERHAVGVRFDNFGTDRTYNLVTIRFRLVQ